MAQPSSPRPAPTLPDEFADRMVHVLGSRRALDDVLAARTRPAVRANPLKASREEVARRLGALGMEVEPVPFSRDSVFYRDPDERPIGLVWEHQAGLFFSQDAASTLPVEALDPQPGERVLDIAAAPGGKTTHIASRMANVGLVVANEPNPGRCNNLISNIDRVGCLNTAVVRQDATNRVWPLRFDRVLVDAPCSNLGGVAQDWGAVFRYSEGRVGSMVGVQRGVLASAFHACRPGGVIVYATCTLEPRENEQMASWFLDEFPVGIEPVDLGVERAEVAELGDVRDEVHDTLRVHPGQVGTDGFFVAKFRKHEDADEWPGGKPFGPRRKRYEVGPEGTVPKVVEEYGLDAPALDDARVVSASERVHATTIPSDDLDAVLAMGPERVGMYFATLEPAGPRLSFDAATLVGRGAARSVEVTPEQARAWMAGEGVPVEEAVPWSIVACGGEPIGCGRAFGDVVPSFVPKQRRVPAEGDLVGFLAL